ncbi:hypothetical protein FJY90_05675 [Candidatus Gottesmanbacteria bacterium]|nr:hypothetical protein [Candidatus Gottesmanbacteria bacterium]
MLTLNSLLAACDPVIGCVSPPPFITSGIDPSSGQLTGIMVFLNSLLRLVFIIAGLFGFLNLIIAGFQFMSAGGDPKNIGKAWEKIWQSFLGLLLIVGSFLLAAIIGILLFKDPFAILRPSLGPR